MIGDSNERKHIGSSRNNSNWLYGGFAWVCTGNDFLISVLKRLFYESHLRLKIIDTTLVRKY